MKALRVLAPGEIVACETQAPKPSDGYLLVETLVAGVCGSDLHRIYDAYPDRFPFPDGAPGHEGVGRVVWSANEAFQEGDSVLLAPDHRASRCFAEVQILPEASVIVLPNGADPGVMFLAQQYGTVLFALKRFECTPQVSVAAIVGAGPAGIMFTRALKARGVDVVVVTDKEQYRLDSAIRCGADITVLEGERSLADAIEAEGGVEGANLVIEASGRDRGREMAVEAVGRDGVVGLFGLPQGRGPVQIRYDLLFEKRAKLIVSDDAQHEEDLASFRAAVGTIAADEDEWRWMVTHVGELDDGPRIIRMARQREGGIVKAALKMS